MNNKISCDNYNSIDQAIKGYSEALVSLDKKKQEPLDDGSELRTLFSDALDCMVTKAGDPGQQTDYLIKLAGWKARPQGASRLLADQRYDDTLGELEALHTNLTAKGATTFLGLFAEGASYHQLGCPVDSNGKSTLETSGEKMECQFLDSKMEHIQEIVKTYFQSGVVFIETGGEQITSPQSVVVSPVPKPSQWQTFYFPVYSLWAGGTMASMPDVSIYYYPDFDFHRRDLQSSFDFSFLLAHERKKHGLYTFEATLHPLLREGGAGFTQCINTLSEDCVDELVDLQNIVGPETLWWVPELRVGVGRAGRGLSYQGQIGVRLDEIGVDGPPLQANLFLGVDLLIDVFLTKARFGVGKAWVQGAQEPGLWFRYEMPLSQRYKRVSPPHEFLPPLNTQVPSNIMALIELHQQERQHSRGLQALVQLVNLANNENEASIYVKYVMRENYTDKEKETVFNAWVYLHKEDTDFVLEVHQQNRYTDLALMALRELIHSGLEKNLQYVYNILRTSEDDSEILAILNQLDGSGINVSWSLLIELHQQHHGKWQIAYQVLQNMANTSSPEVKNYLKEVLLSSTNATEKKEVLRILKRFSDKKVAFFSDFKELYEHFRHTDVIFSLEILSCLATFPEAVDYLEGIVMEPLSFDGAKQALEELVKHHSPLQDHFLFEAHKKYTNTNLELILVEHLLNQTTNDAKEYVEQFIFVKDTSKQARIIGTEKILKDRNGSVHFYSKLHQRAPEQWFRQRALNILLEPENIDEATPYLKDLVLNNFNEQESIRIINQLGRSSSAESDFFYQVCQRYPYGPLAQAAINSLGFMANSPALTLEKQNSAINLLENILFTTPEEETRFWAFKALPPKWNTALRAYETFPLSSVHSAALHQMETLYDKILEDITYAQHRLVYHGRDEPPLTSAQRATITQDVQNMTRLQKEMFQYFKHIIFTGNEDEQWIVFNILLKHYILTLDYLKKIHSYFRGSRLGDLVLNNLSNQYSRDADAAAYLATVLSTSTSEKEKIVVIKALRELNNYFPPLNSPLVQALSNHSSMVRETAKKELKNASIEVLESLLSYNKDEIKIFAAMALANRGQEAIQANSLNRLKALLKEEGLSPQVINAFEAAIYRLEHDISVVR